MPPHDAPPLQFGLRAMFYVLGINPAKGKGISSGHPGGVMVLFADGHVRFLGEHLDNEALEALSTRDGGEAIGEESLQ